MAVAKILVIDDEPVLSGNIKTYLELHGYDCLSVSNGQEGLQMIQSKKPDLLVLDILMPNMDGYTMLHELKKRGRIIPCIVLTAREKLKDLFEMENISRFMTKPVDLGKLKETIEEILREKKET